MIPSVPKERLMPNSIKIWTYPQTNNLQDFIGAGIIYTIA